MSKNALQAADVGERSPTNSFCHLQLSLKNPVSDANPGFELLSPTWHDHPLCHPPVTTVGSIGDCISDTFFWT